MRGRRRGKRRTPIGDANAAVGGRRGMWHSATLLQCALLLRQMPLSVTLALPSGGEEARTTKIVGRRLLVDGQPLHIKGVNWNPVPKGGVHPKDLDFRGFVEVDSELMARAGINAIRTYETIMDKDVLDTLWRKRIYVLNSVYINAEVPCSSVVEKVRALRDHPAILMWVVGNEWNYNGLYAGLPFPRALAKVAEAVKLIKENDPTHPVATVHGEMPAPATVSALSAVDAWGINKYSGLTFGNLFEAWAGLSDKPMFLGEYGADAYNAKIGSVDEASQAKATSVLTHQIVDASSVSGGVCIGGLIFELADEWWKDGQGNPSKHDVGGVVPGGGPFPDMTFNEEWWGLVEYDGTPREAWKVYARIASPGGTGPPPVPASVQPAWRMKACGAHTACAGKLGNCCPNDSGQNAGCCFQTTLPPSTQPPKPSTTWVPPKPEPSQSHSGKHIKYIVQSGKFATGHFEVGVDGCDGVGECQFLKRSDAQAFCNRQAACTVVLMHPFGGHCAGGLGCYTPRSGELFSNNLWARSGGLAWVKVEEDEEEEPKVEADDKSYVFVGFAEAAEARSLCRPYGHLVTPKDAKKRESLKRAMDTAQAEGKLSKSWPHNTIWLGGQWSTASGQWEWVDGSPIKEFQWADGQPSAANNQNREPWLCMVLDGDMHDSDPPYKFGVICELDSDKGHAALPPPAPSDHSETAVVTVHSATPPVVSPQHSEGNQHGDSDSSQKGFLIAPEMCCDYFFVGFATPTQARHACGAKARLAMPKTSDQQKALREAMHAAVEAGNMTENWPRNTIWLGGAWNIASGQWEWDDGAVASGLPWGPGQPSGSDHQAQEPYMCMMVTSGNVDDSEPTYTFGVFCEREKSLEAAFMVCATDAPGWLRISTVAALACLLVACIRLSLNASVSVSSLPFSARLLLLPLVLVFASLVSSLILGPCLYPLSLPAIILFIVFLAVLRLIASHSTRCFSLAAPLAD